MGTSVGEENIPPPPIGEKCKYCGIPLTENDVMVVSILGDGTRIVRHQGCGEPAETVH